MAATVTCTKIINFYRGNSLVSSSESYESGLKPGLRFTPSAPSHMPDYDSSVYTSYEIIYNGSDYTTGAITCPSSNFTVYYRFYGAAQKPRVDKWKWRASNGIASASQTGNAYDAVNERGSTSSFSYLVWNDLVDKVSEVLSAKGLDWNSRYASFYQTKMSYSDTVLTASRFNSLRYNIGLHYSTGISEVSRGDTVYGYYFKILVNCLNEWIDS